MVYVPLMPLLSLSGFMMGLVLALVSVVATSRMSHISLYDMVKALSMHVNMIPQPSLMS